MAESESLIPAERIERSILLIRGLKIMLDGDLADLYGVETKTLNRAVRRAYKIPGPRSVFMRHGRRGSYLGNPCRVENG